MSSKKSKKATFFSHMRKDCKHIVLDVIQLYKHFLHWNISKIIISLWSILLGIIVTAPFILMMVLIGFLDPINWTELIGFILSGSDVSYDIVGKMAMHPYFLTLMVFFGIANAFLFLLASSYSLLLQSNLSLHYIKGKKLKYKKNLYFSRPHIMIFMSIVCWNIMYLLAPVMIWVGVVFFMYLFFNIGFITFEVLSLLVALASVVLVCAITYLIYRIIFGYVLLAHDHKKKNLLSGRGYVQKSILDTAGKSFWKFLFISIVYAMVLMPFTSFDAHLESQSNYLRDTMIYNSGLIDNLQPEQIQYYEYITSEYSHLSDEEILNKIQSFYTLRIILFFLMYFIFSGLFAYIIVSFYSRVLNKK